MLQVVRADRLPFESEEEVHMLFTSTVAIRPLPCIKGALQLFSPVCIAVR